jgi:drug/metabolite transporter (DMT)-like permease
MSNKRWRADLALLICTIIWGANFVAVKDALTDVSVFVYVAVSIRTFRRRDGDHLLAVAA